MNKWRISDWKSIAKNTLIGTFTIDVGVVRIKGCMLHKKDKKRWINFPSREYLMDGERRFANVVEISDRDKYRCFQQWCLAELDRIITPTPKERELVSETEKNTIPF